MKTYTKTTALISAILLSAALATPAQASEPEPKRKAVVEQLVITSPEVSTPANAAIDPFEMEAVSSTRAVRLPDPVVSSYTPATAPIQTAPVAQPATYTPPPVAAQTQSLASTPPVVQTFSSTDVKAAPVAATGSGRGSALLASAYSQLGVQQDCTAMVEKALRSIGIPVGDLGPAQFIGYGSVVGGPAQPGDILVYGNSHVAIAVDSTTAVHGGWNGGTTGVGPIEVGQGAPTIVRL